MEEYSPPSDRLVIDMDAPLSPSEPSLPEKQPSDRKRAYTRQANQYTPSHQSSLTYRAANKRLSDHNTTNHVHEEFNVDSPNFQKRFPVIHNSISVHPGTTVAGSIARLMNIIQPTYLPDHLSKTQVKPPTVVNNYSNVSRSVHPKVVSDTNSTHQDTDKPPYTYIGLILMAIHNSENKMLTVHGVREKFKSWFPFFNDLNTIWKDSMRHILYRHACFYKAKVDHHSRAYYWAINYDHVQPHYLVRKHTSTRNPPPAAETNYMYNLHEQLGLPAVPHTEPNDKPCTYQRNILKLPHKRTFGSSSANRLAYDIPCDRSDDAEAQIDDNKPEQKPAIINQRRYDQHKRKTLLDCSYIPNNAKRPRNTPTFPASFNPDVSYQMPRDGPVHTAKMPSDETKHRSCAFATDASIRRVPLYSGHLKTEPYDLVPQCFVAPSYNHVTNLDFSVYHGYHQEWDFSS